MDDKLLKEAFVDDMLKGIGKFNLASIPKAWRKATVNPLGSALASAALVGVPAYFAAKPLARGLTSLKGRLMHQTPEKTQQELQMVDQNIGKHKWALASILGALAGGASLAHNYVPKSIQPDSGGLNSFLTWNHKWPKQNGMSPETFDKKRKELGMEKQQMDKEAMFGQPDVAPGSPAYNNPLHDHPGVPVKYSLDLIWEDKYLNEKQKITASMPFKEADPSGSGVVSTGDLTRGAIRAGFGLGAGYLMGKTLGTIFSAPTAVTQTLSATGAIAGMLKNTGVI